MSGSLHGHKPDIYPRRNSGTAAGRLCSSSISDAAANICGYLSGLSSPSVTERTATLCRSRIEAGRADQIADVFDKQNAVILQWQTRRGIGNHLRIQMAAFYRY